MTLYNLQVQVGCRGAALFLVYILPIDMLATPQKAFGHRSSMAGEVPTIGMESCMICLDDSASEGVET